MSTADFTMSDRVRLKQGSGNWKLHVRYRELVGEVEFVGASNNNILRASVAFANRQRLIAVPFDDLERA